MDELEYSADAINTLNRFHRCENIVFVEGEDDELFWTTVFRVCMGTEVVAQSMGSCTQLDRQIERIVNEDLNVLAARDSDFLRVNGQHVEDDRVLYTWGYAIENSLYTADCVSSIASIWTRGRQLGLEEECDAWLNEFYAALDELIRYDAANARHQCGLSVLGDNFTRFAKDGTKVAVASKKVATQIATLAQTISQEMLQMAEGIETVFAWLRGHFLASAVRQFIVGKLRQVGLNKQMSTDSMYTNAMLHFEHSLQANHPHRDYYERIAARAIAVVAYA